MIGNKSFSIFIELKEVLRDYSAEVRLEVYDAIMEYIASGTLIELKPLAKMAFAFMKIQIDKLDEEEKEKKRRLSEAGKKGMSRRYNKVETDTEEPGCANDFITTPNQANQVSEVRNDKETPFKETSPAPPKEYNPKENKNNNNNILLTRTREEAELEKFDALLQEVTEGKHQIWADQMRKTHGIDNVVDYLPSFRNHVIANATVNSVTDINGFKRYFNLSFRYFIRRTPIELLQELKEKSKSKDYCRFCNWMVKKAENVARNINPMTEEELNYLVEKFGKDNVFAAILDLNNRDDLVRKYFSLYRTLLNWIKK